MRKNKPSECRQSYNAQAAVDADASMLILAAPVSQCASDANELVPTIDAIAETIGKPSTVLADTGYANGCAIAEIEQRGIDKIRAEWKLVALAYNCRRLHTLQPAMRA